MAPAFSKIVPLLLAVVAGVGGARRAHADQCAWVEPAVAERARLLLTGQPSILEYCDLCADQSRTPLAVHRVTVQPTEDGYVEVLIDGENLDLAYAYLPRQDGVYVNIADLVGCPRMGGPSELTGDPPRLAAVAPPAAPVVVVNVASPDSALLLMGGAAVSTLCSLAVLALVRRRRSSAGTARALELVDRHTRRDDSGRPA
jgi:hypothetical protein